MMSQFVDMTSLSNFFWLCFISLVKFSYQSKFHVMTIFFYKGLTRNLEIKNTPTWVLPNVWRPGQFRDTKFGMDASNEMLLNAAKCQGYSFYHFWVIKGKPTASKITTPPPPSPPPRLGLTLRYLGIYKPIKHAAFKRIPPELDSQEHFYLWIQCFENNSFHLLHHYCLGHLFISKSLRFKV